MESRSISKPTRSEAIPSPSVRERVGRGCTATRPWRFTKSSPRPENGFSKVPTFSGFLLQLQASQMVLGLQLTINMDPGKAGNVNVRHPLPTLQPATDGGGGSRPTAPWLCNRQSESEISGPLCMPTRSETIPSPSVRERVGRGCTTTRPWRLTKKPARGQKMGSASSPHSPASR